MAICDQTDFGNASLFRTNLHGIIDNGSNWSGSSKSLALGTDHKLEQAQAWKPKKATTKLEAL